uniref:Uncharacterized protein n=1 Tax=viral metagenome TaxID=1070528 RepID=A0A6M3L286_9ZZZZ
MKTFLELLEELLVEEFNKSPNEAKELIKNNPVIVSQAMMNGNIALRGCAMALETK